MGVTLIEFLVIFFFLVITCGMVIGLMVIGTKETMGLGFDKDYLWQDFLKQDQELLNKANIKE